MSDALVEIARRLDRELRDLEPQDPVAWIYRPLEYAAANHEAYLQRFGTPPKEVVMVGMNPGPWGMAQTGVPFGEVEAVRDWMGLGHPIEPPSRVHPKKPVDGLRCSRSEVSGRRLWGWAQRAFGAPESFFRHYFVANYCPLLFLDADGRNLTPDRLPVSTRERLETACDAALRDTVTELSPELIVGVGTWAETRARRALDGLGLTVGRILHPSPASPAANRGWEEQAVDQLARLGAPTAA
jgi:single-strand selective monofunctional uracil DNA glycosylase